MASPNPDTTVNSTPTLQCVANFGGVATTMDTCQFTFYTPNLQPVIGPVALTAISTGVYQFTLPLGTLNVAGTWQAIWYCQKTSQSIQTTQPVHVGQ